MSRAFRYKTVTCRPSHLVVKSQAEALEGDVTYDYCLITTKCLPDVTPTPKLVEQVIASNKVSAWSLIQVCGLLSARC